ncbi:acyl carrier protein [Acidisoma silvae]|uniref:Acyl carrier protein n=1 Tax=Acidisoma silvae TaxID=2802396 RepID=A0A963YWJ4_9PROT|nr:acyl carrier protein [Acidisoma silvae]MCB8878154.1 acyl carrier protein [Acidisoma silvae]
MEDRIREILSRCARLSVPVEALNDEDNLYDAGLSSLATVNVMLAIEEVFSVEFLDHLLTRRSFESISSLAAVIASLKSGALTF